MSPHTKRVLLASAICPWSVVIISVAYSIYYLLTWLGKPLTDFAGTEPWPHPFKPWETIALYSIYGVPTAYICLVVVGLPAYFVARRFKFLSYFTAAATAAIACLSAAFFYDSGHRVFETFLFLLPYGLAIALLFARLLTPVNRSA